MILDKPAIYLKHLLAVLLIMRWKEALDHGMAWEIA